MYIYIYIYIYICIYIYIYTLYIAAFIEKTFIESTEQATK